MAPEKSTKLSSSCCAQAVQGLIDVADDVLAQSGFKLAQLSAAAHIDADPAFKAL